MDASDLIPDESLGALTAPESPSEDLIPQASLAAPTASVKAPQMGYRAPTAYEAAILKAHPELAQGYEPGRNEQLINAAGTGVNSGGLDLLGAPMDTLTGLANLPLAGAEGAMLLAGKLPPTWLDPVNPVRVPGTSEWLKARTRALGGANLIDAQAQDPDAQALHTGTEILGPAPVASAGAKVMGALGDVMGPFSARRPLSAQETMNRTVASSPQSMGAASTALDVRGASPELQQAIVQTGEKTGGYVNTDVARNRLEAEQHGVHLMEGQATRDPVQFSAEQNSTDPRIVKRIKDQEQQMTDALDNIRSEAAPTTVHNDAIANGQIAVDSLKAYDEPIKANIQAKYKALVDANGGTVPIDTGSFVQNVETALKKNYLTKSVPPAADELLTSLKNGEPLDFEGFEAARSRLAEAQRKGGSEGAAAKIIRDQLEQMPLSADAARLKGLANDARSAAKARFDALDADPAYQAAVDETASGVKRGQPSPLADKFLDKYALNAPKANLDTLMGKLDEEGRSAVTSHTLSAVRQSAIKPNGTVSPNGFNSALQKFGPKLESLIPSQTQESLESLGRVITNAKVPPPGHSVNYSKSGVIVNAASHLGGAALNAKTLGMGMPIIKNVAAAKFAKKTLAPGAGLERPPEP